jgi:hypothetical protein
MGTEAFGRCVALDRSAGKSPRRRQSVIALKGPGARNAASRGRPPRQRSVTRLFRTVASLDERSNFDLQGELLLRVDAEAQMIFRGWDRTDKIVEADKEYDLRHHPACGLVCMTTWCWSRTRAFPKVVGTCRPFPPAPSCPRPRCAQPSGCAGRMIPPAGWHDARD